MTDAYNNFHSDDDLVIQSEHEASEKAKHSKSPKKAWSDTKPRNSSAPRKNG